MVDVTKEVAKEISKDVYNDAGKPIAKPAGELLGLVPRAIKAALSPVESGFCKKNITLRKQKDYLNRN